MICSIKNIKRGKSLKIKIKNKINFKNWKKQESIFESTLYVEAIKYDGDIPYNKDLVRLAVSTSC